MSTRGRPTTASRHALWLGALVVTLAGLLGMHGMDNHGAAGMDTMAHAVLTGPEDNGVAAAGHEHMSTTVQAAGPAAAAVLNASGQPIDFGMAGACMAILALALFTLLRLLSRHGEGRVLRVLTRPARAPGYRGRDPDAPSLINLSIQRC